MADNKFISDIQDVNNPPKQPYKYQEFPKMLYREDGAVSTVHDEKEERVARKQGFSSEISHQHDYSEIRNGQAKPHEEAVVIPSITDDDEPEVS